MSLVLLLPGMDGTGNLYGDFVRFLPTGLDARIVRYPEDEYLTYEQLAHRVSSVLPENEPYVVVAESYSGHIAALNAARAGENLRAVILVSSFISPPYGRPGQWIATLLPPFLFRLGPPAWLVKWLLLDSTAPHKLVDEVRSAIARVRPEVLAKRLRDALSANNAPALSECTAPVVFLIPDSDRLLPKRVLEELVAAKPNGEIVRIAGPHLILQCHPQETIAAIRRFLS